MWEEHASFARPPPPIVNRCSDSITIALPVALNRFSRVACFWAFKAKNVVLFSSLARLVALSLCVFLSFAFAKNNQSVWARNVFVLMFTRRRRQQQQQQYAQSASGKWWSASSLSSTSSLGFSSTVQCEWLQTSLDVDGRCRSLEKNESERNGRWHMLKRRSCTLFRMSTDQSTNEKVLPHRCLLDISPQQRKDINEYLTRIIFITADGEKEEKRLRSRFPVPRRRVQFPDSAVVFSDDLFAPSRTEIS